MRQITRTSQQFRDTLSEIRKQVEFVARAHKLIRHSQSVFNWNDLEVSTKQLVRDFHGGKNLPQEQIYEALFILSCSHFEEYIRRSLGSIVDLISRKVANFDDLDAKIQKTNLINSGKILSQMERHKRISELDIYQLAKNLGGCHPGSERFVLNSDAYMFFATRVSSEEIDELFKAVNITDYWDDVGKSPQLKIIFQENSIRKVGKNSKSKLNDIIKTRNNLVHRGLGVIPILENDVYEAIDFLGAFSESFTDVIKIRCQNY